MKTGLKVMRLEILKRRNDFLTVKTGCSWGTPGFLLQAKLKAGPSLDDRRVQSDAGRPACVPRFGITVTNHTVRRMIAKSQNKSEAFSMTKAKIKACAKLKKAKTDLKRGPVSVLRNKMRRRLKEALRQVAPLHAKHGIDYVIIGRDACLSLNYEILLKDLEKSFQKVHRRIIPTSTD